jgi:hypothetical protein
MVSRLQLESAIFQRFDKVFLHPQVFGKLQNLDFEGSIRKIDESVFRDLSSLKTILLTLYNLRAFLHSNGKIQDFEPIYKLIYRSRQET